MIRTALVLFLVAVVAVTAMALTGEPGHATLTWLGWRVDTTAAAAALITLFSALAASPSCATPYWAQLPLASCANRSGVRCSWSSNARMGHITVYWWQWTSHRFQCRRSEWRDDWRPVQTLSCCTSSNCLTREN